MGDTERHYYYYYYDYCTDLMQYEYNVQINTNYKYDNKFLNSSIVFASMSSSGRVFQSLMADGKNDIATVVRFGLTSCSCGS